jgi:hypothetical protein
MITGGLFAQQTVSSLEQLPMKHYCGHLVVKDVFHDNKTVTLKKTDLQSLLTNEQFLAYNKARNCYIASIPLLTLGGCVFTIATVFFGIGLHNMLTFSRSQWVEWLQEGFDPRLAAVVGGYLYAGSLISLIPGIVLISYGSNQMNKIASHYNSTHHLCLQIGFGCTDYGVGMKIKF